MEQLVAIFGSGTIVILAVAWLARSLTAHVLSRDLERFKAALQAQSELEREKLRAELTRQTLEHEIRFRRVDDKVAEVLTDVYRRLFRLYENVSNYVKIIEWSGEPSKEEKLKVVTEANREFWDSILLSRVYVPPKLYEQVHSLAKRLTTIANDMTHGLAEERQDRFRDKDRWAEAYRAVEKEVTPLFTAIVQEVQKRLGVEDIEEHKKSDKGVGSI